MLHKGEDHEEFVSDPPQPWHLDAAVDAQTQRTLLLSTIEDKLHGRQSLVFACHLDTKSAKYSARIIIVDPDSVEGFTPSDLPVSVDGVAELAFNLEQVLDRLSSERLWAAANGNSEIKTAIQILCRERLIAKGSYSSMADVPEFAVGSDFYPSLVRSQAAGNGKFSGVAREGCASAVMRLPTLEWKPFYVKPRKADGAVPLRAHLTKSGPALRLMAWRLPVGGGLEFANVGEKWEEEISYTDPAEAV